VRISRLRLFHYRNIEELEIFPSGGTSLFSGQNGQGKTNLLESVYLLGYGRSFRTANPQDCIQHGHTACRVEGTVEHGALSRDLQVSITKKEKKLYLLGKAVSLEEFVGNLHILAFTHEHQKVVGGGPLDRRAFLDRAMVTVFPGHVSYLTAYGRALRQRNRMLASIREEKERVNERLLESWDEALVKPGVRILRNRLKYVELMKEKLPSGLFGTETLKMHYFSTVNSEGLDTTQIEEQFRRRLYQARANDQRRGYTSIGPHRDDLKLYVNGKSLADFGSAGQQRSSLLSLYFSQMEIHREAHGFYPVFLVDDAEAELDERRLQIFITYLLRRTQTFLTSAKGFLLSVLPEKAGRFEVQDGRISALSTDA
jgi:DNA replication and repair protein RecF